ncbi:MAG: hypothetical protein RL490_1832 [Pseudomonadota bacterium]|jgi:choice-of-anchor C domain-containing protein
MKILLLLGSALALSSAASAVTVVNGSFEDGIAIGPSGVAALPTDDVTSLPGWRVLADGIDYVDSTVYQASNGNRSVDLSTGTPGGVVQRIGGFTQGLTYQISFDISADPNDPALRPKTKRGLVSATGGNTSIFDYVLTDANSPTNMRWQTYTYRFQASSAFQNIQFRSLDQSEYGIVLDNVSISAVPEAASWVLMIAGFGMVGFAARRRRGRVVSA